MRWLAYPVGLAAALPTTACVLLLWVGYARLADGNRDGSLFVPMLFLFVPLILGVSLASNLVAVAAGHVAGLIAPGADLRATAIAAAVSVVAGCVWTQRGTPGLRGSAPVSVLPIALFAATDVLILAGSLSLLSGASIF